jgi:hypothetical protein
VKLRNCAWTVQPEPVIRRVVWAREGAIAFQCPKSVISAQSTHILDQFQLWKQFGGGIPLVFEAKEAEGILLLEKEWQRELQHG